MNTIHQNEIWKQVDGFPDYEVSNYGRVKSFQKVKPKILKHEISKNGYCRIVLQRNGERTRLLVHRLVLQTFSPIKDSTLQVNHRDGNKQNNHLVNLEWCTSSQNPRHAYRSGLSKRKIGEKSHRAKLTNAQARNIVKRYSRGACLWKHLLKNIKCPARRLEELYAANVIPTVSA